MNDEQQHALPRLPSAELKAYQHLLRAMTLDRLMDEVNQLGDLEPWQQACVTNELRHRIATQAERTS